MHDQLLRPVGIKQPYLHADLALKQRALNRIGPLSAPKTRRYRPDDQLLAFLEAL